MLKRHISIGVFVVYIDTGSSMPISPSKSRDLSDELNYFICIKDFNAETITSLKLNLFSFFICGCQHHERKTICLYVYISDIRQTFRLFRFLTSEMLGR
jgi:hypothetical protein